MSLALLKWRLLQSTKNIIKDQTGMRSHKIALPHVMITMNLSWATVSPSMPSRLTKLLTKPSSNAMIFDGYGDKHKL